MINKILNSIVLLFISILITILLLFLLYPNYTFYSYNNFMNMLKNNNTFVGSSFPNFDIYNKDHTTLYKALNLNKRTFVIIDNCSSKRNLINKYIRLSNDFNETIIYIYVKSESYENDIYHLNKNVKVFKMSYYDMILNFSISEIINFPMVFILDEKGLVINKEK